MKKFKRWEKGRVQRQRQGWLKEKENQSGKVIRHSVEKAVRAKVQEICSAAKLRFLKFLTAIQSQDKKWAN